MGYGSIVVETVNANTLASFVKEQIPEHVVEYDKDGCDYGMDGDIDILYDHLDGYQKYFYDCGKFYKHFPDNGLECDKDHGYDHMECDI